MSKAEFTALLVEFTATHHCSRNWLETVVEWVRTANAEHDTRRECAQACGLIGSQKTISHYRQNQKGRNEDILTL